MELDTIMDCNSDSFLWFLKWYVEKLRYDENCDGWTDEQITERVLDVIEKPYKFEKEMLEFKKDWDKK